MASPQRRISPLLIFRYFAIFFTAFRLPQMILIAITPPFFD
jgi:hypothetical protein